MTIRDSFTFDNLTLLKDAGAVTASGAATVGGQARYLDFGDVKVEGHLLIDVSAVDTADGNESYRAVLQGSNTTNFASTVELASLNVSAIGRATAAFQTRIGSVNYRYVRLYLIEGGTTPSLNCTACVVLR